MPRLKDVDIKRLRQGLREDVDAIAFHEATEPPGCSPLNAEKRLGTYACGVCNEIKFSSAHKYESGSGWPSFYQTYDKCAVETKTDYKMIVPRTEFHCANCGAHLGHVFNDGPQPTGLRYCVNGKILRFKPEQ